MNQLAQWGPIDVYAVHLKACQHPLKDAAVHTILDGLRKLQGASWMFQDLRLYKYPKQQLEKSSNI